MASHRYSSDHGEDEEEWLEEELLSQGKKKKKTLDGNDEGWGLTGDGSDSESDSGARGDRAQRSRRGGSCAVPPPLKKRKGATSRRLSSPSGSSEEGRSDNGTDSGDGFGEDLMGDDEDRAYLASLTEMERERILNERYEARKKRLERLEFRRKLQQSKATRTSARAPAKAAGRKTGTKASALSNLKAKREEKATRAKRRAQEIDTRLDIETVSSEESDSNYERSKRAKHERSRLSSYPDWELDKGRNYEQDIIKNDQKEPRILPTLEQVNSIRLDRSRLEKWVDQPYFERTVPQFFVRVGIGMNREQQNAYRMAQIVEKGTRLYTLGKKKTQYVLKLSHGANSKNFSLEFISNSPITPAEYERWLREMEKADMEILTPDQILKKQLAMESTRSYVYTHEDIEQMIRQKDELRARPVNLGATKACLLQQLAAAAGTDEVAKIEKELERLSQLGKRDVEEQQQKQAKIGNINKRNKAINMVTSQAAAQSTLSRTGETFDPFVRRPTAPTIPAFRKAGSLPPSSSSSSSSSSPSFSGSAPQPPAVSASPALPSEKAVSTEDEGKRTKETALSDPDALLQLHTTLDIEIDVDLDVSSKPAMKVNRTTLPSTAATPKPETKGDVPSAKAISLDDYKRRRGLL